MRTTRKAASVRDVGERSPQSGGNPTIKAPARGRVNTSGRGRPASRSHATLPLGDARSLSRRGVPRSLEGRRGGHDRARRAGRAPRRVEAPLEETCFQAEPGSAICVQRFDDSLNSAIRTTYRISLRSSSLREPRYPSTRVVCFNKSLGGAGERLEVGSPDPVGHQLADRASSRS